MKKIIAFISVMCIIFLTGCVEEPLKPNDNPQTTLPAGETTIATTTATTTTLGSVKPGLPIVSANFEEGSADGFKARGTGSAVKAEITKEEANSGTYSLKVTGRSKDWNGVTLDVTRAFSKIDAYAFEVKAWVKLPEDATPCVFRISAQINKGGGESYQNLSGEASSLFVSPEDGWVELIGYGVWTKDSYDILNIYIETDTDGATNDFFFDDFTILED